MTHINLDLSEAAGRELDELVQWTGEPVRSLVEKAIREYNRKVFFDKYNAAYTALRADPAAWAEVEAERREWDETLLDGLDPNERWTEDGRSFPTAEETST